MSDFTTWLRFKKGKGLVRRTSAGKPYGFGWEPRESTEDEAAEAIAKEEQEAKDAETRAAFESLPSKVAAERIRSILEFMTPESNPLDRLTPEEWEELANRLS